MYSHFFVSVVFGFKRYQPYCAFIRQVGGRWGGAERMPYSPGAGPGQEGNRYLDRTNAESDALSVKSEGFDFHSHPGEWWDRDSVVRVRCRWYPFV